MVENFPNLVKEKSHKFGKHRVPVKSNSKRPIVRHIIIKMPKIKGKEILKSRKRKPIIYV